ncbi:MAG: hypothetical protein V9G98_27825 [Candidatus Competibacter sp.]
MFSNKIYSVIFLLIVPVCVVTPANSQDISNFCSEKDTTIYFENGIWADRFTAGIDLKELENAVKTAVSPEQFDKIGFDLAYNTTDGRIADLLEAFVQSISSDVTLFWRTLATLVPMPASLRDNMLSQAAAIDEAAILNRQDVADHVAHFKNTILEGKKALVVSHSQGNFFVNQEYFGLSAPEKSSFGIVAVANPATNVATGGPHVTLVEDLVIEAIILAKNEAGLPIPELPNVTNFLTLADLTGHFFVESYLVPSSNSKNMILNDIVSVRSNLSLPVTSAGQGIITVTLTWGAQPDVDLHAFEPNGTHVYYANRFGPSGFLDVDDVTSYGPEHYFVGCDTLEIGTYRIGVNYYYGTAPEIANIVVQAGLHTRGFSQFLPVALGSSGDASPQPIGTITVTGDRQNGFQFNIQ